MKKYVVFLLIAMASNVYAQEILVLKTLKNFNDYTVDVQGFTYLKELFGAECIIETGTYSGASAKKFASIFSHVYTVELSKSLYDEAKKNLSEYKNVSVFYGDSAQFLKTNLPHIQGKKIIFLDAHFCGGETAIGNPLLAELEAIRESQSQNDVILIDDIRIFTPDADIPLSLIYERLKKINANFTIVSYGDALLAYEDATIVPSDVVDACTKSLFFNKEKSSKETLFAAENVIAQAKDSEKNALLSLNFPFPESASVYYRIWQALIHTHNKEYAVARNILERVVTKKYDHPCVSTYLATIMSMA